MRLRNTRVTLTRALAGSLAVAALTVTATTTAIAATTAGDATPSPAATATATASAAPTAAATPTATTTTAATAAAAAAPQDLTATLIRRYAAFDANQGVAVDGKYFYAVDNRTVTKHDRATGAPLLQFVSDASGPLIHFDSGTVVDNKLYLAHSNYNQVPMASSIEVLDTRTMRHIETFSFGIDRGSLTWIDRHDGAWWAGFANYDTNGADGKPYGGGSQNTQVVKLNDRFEVVEAWIVPAALVDRFRPMSNSGGSWGPDGRLWLTGHDNAEVYVMELPEAGTTLTWVATVALPDVEGQAIAWDRSDKKHPTFWAIKRTTKEVLNFEVPFKSIQDAPAAPFRVVGPGSFVP
ncbi:hypothetical protein [Parafrankia sp. EUN1f]|uniref:hypothetical protein n=1 Tax=Parafrankia sp. EUN1f TaxID=102897 RepID=UPI0001C44A9A|nr:hypothetical protein [Parafrankia sp. EUN1f]EFC84151.1 hypothetical protein FrEUN1fDRAFT_2762 [Parafrankia sp. EUN1f]